MNYLLYHEIPNYIGISFGFCLYTLYKYLLIVCYELISFLCINLISYVCIVFIILWAG